MVGTKVEVLGLRQAIENLKQLDLEVGDEINRQALREMGWRLARPMRQATYTTFKRQTGAIRRGLSVQVRREADDTEYRAWVVEYKQSVRGALTAFAGKIRRAKRIAGKAVPRDSTAFYWRFLELGTGPRRSKATPKFLRQDRRSKSGRILIRQAHAASEWAKSANRGGITARSWLRPVFSSHADDAINAYREKLITLIDQAVSKMPKR